MDHVKTAISSLKLAEPTTHGGLTIFPLTSGLDSDLGYLLLEEGLRKGLVTIREVSEGGSVPELTVENRADLPLLIVDGEELVGAKQNRVANLTMLLPAKKTTIIPVSCVEAGRWSYSRPDFGVTDRVQNARGRAEKLADVRGVDPPQRQSALRPGPRVGLPGGRVRVAGSGLPDRRDERDVRPPPGDARRLR